MFKEGRGIGESAVQKGNYLLKTLLLYSVQRMFRVSYSGTDTALDRNLVLLRVYYDKE